MSDDEDAVWTASPKAGSGGRSTYHTDPECDNLQLSDNKRRHEGDVAEGIRGTKELCERCAGKDLTHDGGNQSLHRDLLAADPDT